MVTTDDGDLRGELAALVGALRAQVAWHARGGVFAAATGAAPPLALSEAPEAPSRRATLTLAEIRTELGDCQRCKLAPTRNKIVFGNGSETAPLMFVGEAPGADEDRIGDPFVGRAGELLDKMIEAMGWTRATVYVANTLKCLKYTAMVQLGDGSWERIGRLVNNRYAGDVMSVDAAGNLVPRKVTGWYASPLADRPVYRLTYKNAKAAGAARVAIQLTGDHEVLTDRGFVAVQELPLGAQIATGQGLSDVATDVVVGTLLGDGSIPKKIAYLQFGHSQRQEEYALFKARLLGELQCSSTYLEVAAGDRTDYPVVHVRSRAHRALHAIRAEFYGPRKRVPVRLAEDLTPRMVAIWFMDDGYMRIRSGGRNPLAEIATCAFDSDDLEVLCHGLLRLGVEGYVRANRIFFDVEQTRQLSKLIAPFVPPCMRRKLHPGVAAVIPYDASLWEPGPTKVAFDTAVVERIEHTSCDKTFFCIDVEETHNFVTAGGVVHNCRPPGNRNPEPDETAACQPFLFKQIEAIAPRVIVTLGRPAANLLLGNDAPISALRGRFHEFRGVRLMPTFHPAYLLREPGKKRDAWNDLKLVMAELDRLGIRPPNPPRG